MSEEVKNWVPGEPGKYVTILDLKERWMKKKQQEEEEEGKKKEAEKVCERFDVLNIGGGDDRVERKRVGGRWKSGGRGRGGRRGRSEWSGLKGADAVGDGVRNSTVDDRQRVDGYLVRVPEIEKSEDKKNDVDDVKVNGDDAVGNSKAKVAGGGRYQAGTGSSQDRSFVKARVSDVTENVEVERSNGEQNLQIGKARSVGDEKETRRNCPSHSRRENQCSGGFWVCKYIEPSSRGEAGESVKGNDVAEGDVVDIVRKKDVEKEELKWPKKHRRHRKVRGEMTVDRENEDAMQLSGEFLGIINHDDDVPRKTWQPREEWEMAKGVKDELIGKRMQKDAVAVDKDSRKMISRDGYCQKNDVKLQRQTVESSVEIEEHSTASTLAKREMNRKGKLRAMGNPVGGRSINDTERFKAERTSGFLTMDNTHVDQVGAHHKNADLTPKLENMDPMDRPEKSEAAAVGAGMVEYSSDNFGDMRNEIYSSKMFGNRRHLTNRTFANKRSTDPKNFNGKTREMKLRKKEGLVWVKKGEAPVNNEGRKD